MANLPLPSQQFVSSNGSMQAPGSIGPNQPPTDPAELLHSLQGTQNPMQPRQNVASHVDLSQPRTQQVPGSYPQFNPSGPNSQNQSQNQFPPQGSIPPAALTNPQSGRATPPQFSQPSPNSSSQQMPPLPPPNPQLWRPPTNLPNGPPSMGPSALQPQFGRPPIPPNMQMPGNNSGQQTPNGPPNPSRPPLPPNTQTPPAYRPQPPPSNPHLPQDHHPHTQQPPSLPQFPPQQQQQQSNFSHQQPQQQTPQPSPHPQQHQMPQFQPPNFPQQQQQMPNVQQQFQPQMPRPPQQHQQFQSQQQSPQIPQQPQPPQLQQQQMPRPPQPQPQPPQQQQQAHPPQQQTEYQYQPQQQMPPQQQQQQQQFQQPQNISQSSSQQSIPAPQSPVPHPGFPPQRPQFQNQSNQSPFHPTMPLPSPNGPSAQRPSTPGSGLPSANFSDPHQRVRMLEEEIRNKDIKISELNNNILGAKEDKAVLLERMKRIQIKNGESGGDETSRLTQTNEFLQRSLAEAQGREAELQRALAEKDLLISKQTGPSVQQAQQGIPNRNHEALLSQIEGLQRQLVAFHNMKSFNETLGENAPLVAGLRQQLVGVTDQNAVTASHLAAARNKILALEQEILQLRAEAQELKLLSTDLVGELECTTLDLNKAMGRIKTLEETSSRAAAVSPSHYEELLARLSASENNLIISKGEVNRKSLQTQAVLKQLRNFLMEVEETTDISKDNIEGVYDDYSVCAILIKKLRDCWVLKNEQISKLKAHTQTQMGNIKNLPPKFGGIIYHVGTQTETHISLKRDEGEFEYDSDGENPMENISPPPAVKEFERTELLTSCDATTAENLQVDWREQLGVGVFSDVFRGALTREVAVKNFRGEISDRQFDSFVREALILRKLTHPNIVKFFGVSVNGPALNLLMEPLPGPSLFQIIHEQRIVLSVPQILGFSLELASALRYIHRLKIVHCDVKPTNLLLDSKGRLKLIDFGLARKMDSVGNIIVVTIGGMHEGGGGGTPAYQPPEALVGDPISVKVDVFGFAVCIWELLSCELPWNQYDIEQMKRAVISGDRPLIPSRCPPELSECLSACWAGEPSRRPNMKAVYRTLSKIRGPTGSLF